MSHILGDFHATYTILGFSRVPLLETIEYLMVRTNTLLILGEDTGRI
jgi:hypothetical protein